MSEPVVLLWGESDYLLRLAAEKELGEIHPTEIDAQEWRPGATADLATPSLFGEARALLVTHGQHLPEEGAAEIAAYASAPAPDARLILTVTVGSRAKGPPAVLTRRLGDGVKARRVAVERKELRSWVAARAAARGLPAQPAGVAALIDTLGEDPAELDQAVDQLASAFPNEGVTARTVAAQFRGLGDRRIWELCDAAFGRDPASAMRALSSMLAAREEPLVILSGIASRLRDLVRVRELPDRIPPQELARAAGIRFEWQARRYREQARRFSAQELIALHGRLVEADQALKLGGPGDVILPMVVGRIAGA